MAPKISAEERRNIQEHQARRNHQIVIALNLLACKIPQNWTGLNVPVDVGQVVALEDHSQEAVVCYPEGEIFRHSVEEHEVGGQIVKIRRVDCRHVASMEER